MSEEPLKNFEKILRNGATNEHLNLGTITDSSKNMEAKGAFIFYYYC